MHSISAAVFNQKIKPLKAHFEELLRKLHFRILNSESKGDSRYVYILSPESRKSNIQVQGEINNSIIEIRQLVADLRNRNISTKEILEKIQYYNIFGIIIEITEDNIIISPKEKNLAKLRISSHSTEDEWSKTDKNEVQFFYDI